MQTGDQGGWTATEMVPLWTRSFIFITLTNFLIFMSFMMVNPTMSVFVERLTDSETIIGAVIGVFTVSAVIMRGIAGVAVDLYGRRRLQLWAIFAFGVVTLVFQWTFVIWLIFVARILFGAVWGLSSTATSTVAADIVPLRRRSEGMGYFGVAVNVAQSFAPVVGFWLVDRWGFSVQFTTAAVFCWVAVLTASQVGETKPESGEPGETQNSEAETTSLWQAVRRQRPLEPGAYLPTGLMLLTSIAFGFIVTLIPLYTSRLGLDNPGLFYTVYALGVVGSRPFAGRFADRSGAFLTLVPGLILEVVGLVLIGSWPDLFLINGLPGGLFLGGLIFGIGYGTVFPTLQTVAIDRSPLQRRGAASATFYMGLDAGIGTGTFVLGAVAEQLGFASTYTLSAVLPVAGLIYLLLNRSAFEISASERTV